MLTWLKRYRQSGTYDSNQSREGLLGDDDHGCYYQATKRRPRPTYGANWCLHGFLILFYSLLYLAVTVLTIHSVRSTEENAKAPNYHLPDPKGLRWENRRFPTNIVNNPFTGDPRPELDEAWDRLLQNDNIRVPKNYLEELNLTTIYTLDGSEGIVSLSVYHSLHCLKKVKRMVFKEHYHTGKSDEAMAREAKHVDHCIEYIRESLMCHPDLSMVSFRWINNTAQYEDKSAFYPTNFDVALHECANWEALDSWANKRVFDLFDVNLLQRPPPYQAGL
ncbi:hypothetical protein F4859DRAFT_478156 [Xylaria cf. heliscus]|nr:hypothetical protein F4859DRAFT_478156 [Xylaria cf. heliscus]